jgi:hypothetical protein
LPPTSHLEIRQLQRRYAKPLATCLAPVWRIYEADSRDGRQSNVACEADARRSRARTAFTDYLNRVPKRGAIETLHVDGERVKLKIDECMSNHTRAAASLGVFDVLATEVD